MPAATPHRMSRFVHTCQVPGSSCLCVSPDSAFYNFEAPAVREVERILAQRAEGAGEEKKSSQSTVAAATAALAHAPGVFLTSLDSLTFFVWLPFLWLTCSPFFRLRRRDAARGRARADQRGEMRILCQVQGLFVRALRVDPRQRHYSRGARWSRQDHAVHQAAAKEGLSSFPFFPESAS